MQLLKDLWYNYQLQDPTDHNEERKQLLRELVALEDEFFKELTEKQIEVFEKCTDHLHDMASISACEAFVTGVRFAAAFFTDAFSSK